MSASASEQSIVSLFSRRSFLRSAGVAISGVAISGAALSKSAFSLAGRQDEAPVDRVTLNDGWEFLKDSLDGPWEAWLTEQTNPWTKVTLPHCFNATDACDPDIPYYQGPGWYRTHVQLNNPFSNGRTLLHFEGAGQECKVYIGEDFAGEHVGGYDEFVLDITTIAAKHASNKTGVPLAVMCTNAHNLDRIPSQMSDFTLYGGLYRKVHVLYVPPVFIKKCELRVTPRADKKSYRVSISVTPSGPWEGLQITTDVLGPDGRSVIPHGSFMGMLGTFHTRTYSHDLQDPALWSPDAPQLYTARVILRTSQGQQVIEQRFGCRSFHFEDQGAFFLNGEKCFLRGTHRHEDHAEYGAATPDGVVRKEMQLIKDMGANFIRLGHYQQSKLVLDLCDELGLIVWEEIPWCRAGVGSEKMQAMVLEKLRTMLEQHGHHPSIVFWGLGNEDDWPGEFPSIDKEAIRALMKKAHDLAHELDPTRLTSYRRCDFAREIPDVYSPSIWAGWYGGAYTDYQKSLETQRTKQKHMLHIEWGADSHAGRHAEKVPVVEIPKGETTAETGMAFKMTGGSPRMSKDGDWSETYACDLFDWHLKVQETLPWFAGSAQWIFKDFTTPLRPENPVPRINQKGLVARDLTLKESYYVFQSYWAKKPMVHIYGHTWRTRWGAAHETKTIKVYSNCAEVEIFLNGKSLGKKKRNSQDFPAAGLRWETTFVEGENTLRAVAGDLTDSTTFNYSTRVWGKPKRLVIDPPLDRINGMGADALFNISAHDADGNVCYDSNATVRIQVAGEADLVANMGTPWGSRVVQLANGKAHVHVILHSPQARYTIAVSSPGMEGATTTHPSRT